MRTPVLAMALAAALLSGGAARAESAVGDWGGLLSGRLHLVLHVTQAQDGRYAGVLESVDQGDAMIPVDKLEAGADQLNIAISRIGASYAGKWDDGQKAWVGVFAQGADLPLTLKRLDAAGLAALKPSPTARPQDDAAAAALPSYRPEAIRLENPRAPGVTLAGVFTKPPGTGPFPAVMLIAGSGRQSRDEMVLRHRIFLVLADELNRRGVAVLRYDKRGVGESSGDFQSATTADFASDAEAAFRYLSARPDVDPKRVGLIGHSEGGVIAPIVAVADPKVAFVVLMAGPGVRGAELLELQQRLIAQAESEPPAAISVREAHDRAVIAAVVAASDREDAVRRVAALTTAQAQPAPPPSAGAPPAVQLYTSPWMYHFLRYDPQPTLARLRTPLLAIGGSLDLMVEPKQNLGAIRRATKDDRYVTVTELPGLNHLFQTAHTGSPFEFGRIEETISPAALKLIGDWVVAHVQPRKAPG